MKEILAFLFNLKDTNNCEGIFFFSQDERVIGTIEVNFHFKLINWILFLSFGRKMWVSRQISHREMVAGVASRIFPRRDIHVYYYRLDRLW